MKILSTKKLKSNQRDLLLGAGFSLVDYDAIKIEALDFKMPLKIKNAIFTSQNGVKAILTNEFVHSSKIENCFCVGQKTKLLLEENNLKVIETADYGTDLAEIITKEYKKEGFHFFCGMSRRDELPTILKRENIKLSEIITYKTTLNPRKFDQDWDGILFFSPSGVESYFQLNEPYKYQRPERVETAIFCIGSTTADAAKKYFKKVVISNSTSVESVIAKAVKTLK